MGAFALGRFGIDSRKGVLSCWSAFQLKAATSHQTGRDCLVTPDLEKAPNYAHSEICGWHCAGPRDRIASGALFPVSRRDIRDDLT